MNGECVSGTGHVNTAHNKPGWLLFLSFFLFSASPPAHRPPHLWQQNDMVGGPLQGEEMKEELNSPLFTRDADVQKDVWKWAMAVFLEKRSPPRMREEQH